jgi:cyclophilin family peptidyl-prolyl cis-trans isomerase
VGTNKRNRQKANRQQALQQRAKQERRAKVRKRGLLYGVGIPVIIVALFGVAHAINGNGSSASKIDGTLSTDMATATTAPSDSTASTTASSGGKEATPAGCPAADGSSPAKKSFTAAPKMCIDTSKSYTAIMNTSEGTMVFALDVKKTPQTTNNFVVLSRYHYYDGTVIFRTDPTIDIIQGGGMTNTDTPGYTIKDEGSGYTYKEGDIAMARTSAPDSAGGQWFIVTGANASALDSQGTYVVFGHITTGLDIAQSILGLNSGSGALGGAPSRTVTVKSITIAAT